MFRFVFRELFRFALDGIPTLSKSYKLTIRFRFRRVFDALMATTRLQLLALVGVVVLAAALEGRQDPFKLLGVERDVGDKELRRAYR